MFPRFGTQYSHPRRHYVLADHYLRRNPHYVASEVRHQLFPTNPPVYPASALQKRYHSFQQSGRFTSACSGMIYRDHRLFDDQVTHSFACKPFQNLVQHSTLEPTGVTFAAKRVGRENETDFLRLSNGRTRTVQRKEIETLKNMGVSLMTENLESTMTRQEIADVIAFLRQT